MTVVNSALIATVAVESVSSYTINKLVMTLANTEYSFTFPAGTKTFGFRNRNSGTLKLKHTSGGDYFTFDPYVTNWVNDIKSSAVVTVYFESPSAAQYVELIYWS
jgi:hypothetical protein